jgi:regulator of sirC expression with transglutaminase-like and TPR domain
MHFYPVSDMTRSVNQASNVNEASDATYCRAEAYQYFVEQLPTIDSTESLMRAAVGVSLHALDDINPERVIERLRVLGLRVRERSPSQRDAAILANLHSVLFEEEGFIGNLERYYNALNSYLPVVLNTRRGLPIVLALIYKSVAEYAGLSVEGLNAPGHFLVRVKCDGRWMIVDPFFGGQLLSRDEAFARLDRVLGKRVQRQDEFLAPANNAQWLTRLIGNLRQLFATEGRRDDLAAMTELNQALLASRRWAA